MKRLSNLTVRVCVAVVASGAAVGIALVVGVADGSNRPSAMTPTTQRTARVAETVPSDVASSFHFLTSTSSTPLPTSLASDLGSAAGGVSPSLGRAAGSVGNQRLWLIPGSSQTCIETNSGYSACGSNTLLEQRGLWIMLKPVSGAAPTMYGIVPDSATVSGDAVSAKVAQSGNAVMVTPSSNTPGPFAIHTANGATADMSVPAATGHPQ
jgi:hypothetical protein